MLRIVQVGLGPLGRMMVADVASRGLGRVVGAADIDSAVVGKRLGELVPVLRSIPDRSEATLVISSSIEAAAAVACDCAVVTTSSDLAACVPTIKELLTRGISVVSTCEELLYPWLRHRALAEELSGLCVKHGVRLVGTGVNPGFLMDALPVGLTAVCRSVRKVRVWRIQDATTRRVPFQKKIGAGLDDAGFAARVKDGTLRHVGLGESLHFIAHYLGLRIDRWEESIAPVYATAPLECALGEIPVGKISGVRQTGIGYSKGDGKHEEAIITLDFQAAIGQADPHDRVMIDGEPALDVRFSGGVHGDVATTAITLNAIPSLLAAPPGLHTMATLPLVYCRPRG